MTHTGPEQLDSSVVEQLHAHLAAPLYRFLLGVLRDGALAEEACQNAFAKLIEQGGGVETGSRKAWLFRVAYREAMAIARRRNAGARAIRNWAVQRIDSGRTCASYEPLVREETVRAVRAAMVELPVEQRQVVAMRIYEEKTFAEIAEQLDIPLGTALGRMRLALKKLRQRLDGRDL